MTGFIDIIKKEGWKGGRFDECGARFDPKGQRIFMAEHSSNIGFMLVVFHEMLHFKSYNALQVTNTEDPELQNYRSGLQIDKRDFSASHFSGINEAVTEELTKRFGGKLRNDSFFAEEVRETNKWLGNHSTTIHGEPIPKSAYDDVYYAKDWGQDFAGPSYEYSYKEERESLHTLIDKLFERNRREFNSQEEIFEIFAKGFMIGNILPIGKLIDRTFGQGTLRKIAELREKKLRNFIESL